MFQSLRVERFKMAAHRDTKEVNGFVLSIAKRGPKICEPKAQDQRPALPEWFRVPLRAWHPRRITPFPFA